MRDVTPARHPHHLGTLTLFALPVLMVMLVSCYEPDPIDSLAVSRDGRWAASVTAKGALSVVDLKTESAPFVRLSNQVKGPVGWSPDSQRLALVEQYPNRPSSLWVVNPAGERPQLPLLFDISYKADPGILNDGRVVFRSDRGQEMVGVWSLDPVSHRIEKLFKSDFDIDRLWTSPAGDSIVYQSAGPEGVDLYWLRLGGNPVRITNNQRRENPAGQDVAFSPDSAGAAFISRGERAPELAWFDFKSAAVTSRVELPGRPRGVAVMSDGRVAVAIGAELRLWRPEPSLIHRELTSSRFEDLPLSLPQAGPDGGMTLVVNRTLLLTGPSAARLSRGVVQAAGIEDLLMLARARAEAGHTDSARATLERLWSKTADIDRKYSIAAARGLLERSQQRWNDSRQWLSRAIELAPENSTERTAAELERLAVGAFDQRSTVLASELLRQLSPPSSNHDLAQWLASGLSNKELTRWLSIAGDFRAKRDEFAANTIDALSREDGWTTHSLAGLQFLLDGDFEPLLAAAQQRQTDRIDNLLAQPGMQLALIRALESKNEGGPTDEELSQTILTQMVRRGDLNGARRFVIADLARPTPLNGYPTMLAQFLGLDETEPLTYRVVTEVLLDPSVATKLDERLTDPNERLLFRMSQVKTAIIASRPEQAAKWLHDCRFILRQIPLDENGANLQDMARQLFLLDIFDARIAEQRGRWDAALDAYRRSLQLIGQIPNEWDALSYEITAAIGLIEAGRTDRDTLASFERVIRSLGDPLINPTRQPAALLGALDNLDQLEKTMPAKSWARPWLLYLRGFCYSQLDWPAQALYNFEAARRLNPPPALLQRILLEDAAVRDQLGQHALAARLQNQLARLPVPEPLRAGALLAQVQAETAAGITNQPIARMNELVSSLGLQPRWRRWLTNQLGGEPAS